MTVASAPAKAGPYTGNDVATTFAFSFKVFADDDLRVIETLLESGVETDLILNGANGYTVVRNIDQDNHPGGSITYQQGSVAAALPSSKTLTLVGDFAYAQPTDIPNGGAFFAQVIENALDRVTMLVKQLKEMLDRSLTLPISTAGVSGALPAPDALQLLRWNSSETALENVDPTSVITEITYGTMYADLFSGTGVQTQFTLTHNPGVIANLDVAVGGVTQRPGVDYTWSSGTTLTFTSAPPLGTNNILVRFAQALPQGATDSAAAAFLQAGAGAVVRSAQDKLREIVSVLDFGAVGDGVTNDGPAFVLAAATGKEVRVPWTSTGYNLGASQIFVQSGQFIRGHNNVLLKSTAAALFVMKGYDLLSGVSDFRINMAGAGAGSSAIYFDTTVQPVWRVRLDRLMFENCYGAIVQSQGGANSYVVDVIAEDIGCTLAKGTQIKFNHSRGFFKWHRVNVDNTVAGASSLRVTWASVQFTKFAGLELTEFDVTGQTAILTPIYDANAINIYIDNTAAPAGYGWLWANRLRAESSMGIGMLIKGTNFLHLNRLDSHAALGDGIQIFNCTLFLGSDIYVRGAKDQTGKLAGQTGLYLDTCADVALASVGTDINDGAGITLGNCTRVNLAGVRSRDNGTFGLRETGTSSDNLVTGASFSLCATAPYSVVSARVTGSNNAGVRLEDSATFVAHKNGVDQTGIASATFTKLTFGTALLNAGGRYNTGTSRWTPPAGSYTISADAICTVGLVAGSEFTLLIYKNGAVYCQSTVMPATVSPCSASIDRVVTANGTDFFEIYVYIGGTGTKTIGGAFSQSSFQGTPLN